MIELISTRLILTDMPKRARIALSDRFDESPLAYHNVNHILHMLMNFETSFADRCTQEEEVLIRRAIWFHDAVYDPSMKDNEEKSAALAHDVLGQYDPVLDGLIMATKKHLATTKLEQWLVDLDLAILATTRDRYREYARQIRQEYAAYDDVEYMTGRAAVLKHLIEAPNMLEEISASLSLPRVTFGNYAKANMTWEREAMLNNPDVESALAT